MTGSSARAPRTPLRIFRQFRERGCIIVSVKESWLNGSPEVQDILIGFAGWMAQQESQRRSRADQGGRGPPARGGKPVGRQAGTKDAKQRKRSGYVKSWEENGARRQAEESRR